MSEDVLGISVDLLGAEPLSGLALQRRVADPGREVADDQDRGVAQLLEVAQLAQHDSPTQSHRGSCGVETELDPQLATALQLGEQILLGHDFVGVAQEQRQLFGGSHRRERVNRRWSLTCPHRQTLAATNRQGRSTCLGDPDPWGRHHQVGRLPGLEPEWRAFFQQIGPVVAAVDPQGLGQLSRPIGQIGAPSPAGARRSTNPL